MSLPYQMHTQKHSHISCSRLPVCTLTPHLIEFGRPVSEGAARALKHLASVIRSGVMEAISHSTERGSAVAADRPTTHEQGGHEPLDASAVGV